jgi:hypothetical protein
MEELDIWSRLESEKRELEQKLNDRNVECAVNAAVSTIRDMERDSLIEENGRLQQQIAENVLIIKNTTNACAFQAAVIKMMSAENLRLKNELEALKATCDATAAGPSGQLWQSFPKGGAAASALPDASPKSDKPKTKRIKVQPKDSTAGLPKGGAAGPSEAASPSMQESLMKKKMLLSEDDS